MKNEKRCVCWLPHALSLFFPAIKTQLKIVVCFSGYETRLRAFGCNNDIIIHQQLLFETKKMRETVTQHEKNRPSQGTSQAEIIEGGSVVCTKYMIQINLLWFAGRVHDAGRTQCTGTGKTGINKNIDKRGICGETIIVQKKKTKQYPFPLA